MILYSYNRTNALLVIYWNKKAFINASWKGNGYSYPLTICYRMSGWEKKTTRREVIVLIPTIAIRFAVISGSNKAKANFDILL